MDDLTRGPEALEWIRLNSNESALASNRFGPTLEAISFVEHLYALGAERVIIHQDSIRDDELTLSDEGGPYADALVVVLPSAPERREQISRICADEISGEGFDPSESKG